jgi:two-component system NtrC family response regulator
VLCQLREKDSRVRIVAVVPEEDEESARIAAASGAWDVTSDGAASVERLRSAAALSQLQSAGSAAEAVRPARPRAAKAVDPDRSPFIGESASMRRIFALIRRVAATEVSVLLTGASGTGKELAARAIHERSHRSQGPFVPINIAAIPESLLESELFGHERGAFTGASSLHKGRLEVANGGTLFLDEIGELSAQLQVKLLRFLEDHVVERVGGHRRIALDMRILAATNRDLKQAVDRGNFREDLFYRLNVFAIDMPPLCERGSDVVLLAEHFLNQYAADANCRLEGFTPEAQRELLRAQWAGNVRELMNVVRRAVLLAEGPRVTAQDLGFAEPPAAKSPIRLREARHTTEAACLREAIQRTHGNKTLAARELGICRTQFYELMHKHAISTESDTADPVRARKGYTE